MLTPQPGSGLQDVADVRGIVRATPATDSKCAV